MSKSDKTPKQSTQTGHDTDSKVVELEEQLAQARESRLRAIADLENFRRRMEAERQKFGAMANMQLVMHILDVVDDIQLARNDDQLDRDRALEVLQILQDKLKGSLQELGIEPLIVNPKDKFDPQHMEAITTIPTDKQEENDQVVEVISQGYRYANQDTIIKNAKVIVSKYKPAKD